MATPNQTINYGTKPPAKNLSGSKTAGAMGNPATPTVKGMPPTPSRTPMPVTPMPATGTTPVTTNGLNSTLQKALGRQTAPAPVPMPVTVAPPPTETVAPVIAEALGTGSLNTSGQYAPGYEPQKGHHVRGKHSGAGKNKHIERQMMQQYGGNWRQAMQNQQAYDAAIAQNIQYMNEGRLTKDPNKVGGELLDGKPYMSPDWADLSTYAQFGAKELNPNAGQVYSDGSPYPSTSSPDPRGNIGSNYGFNDNKKQQQPHWAATHGQGTPQYQQNMQAYQKASTDFATAVQQGRVHYDSATNQMTLDGKPYQEPTFADPSTYGGTVPTTAQAGTEFANAFDWNAATGAQRPGFDNTNLPTGITTTSKKPGQM